MQRAEQCQLLSAQVDVEVGRLAAGLAESVAAKKR